MSGSSRLQLHTSNRLEVLAQQLCRVLAQPLASTLQPESVIVQSNGMARWLTQQIATQLGVCANVLFLFPQKFVAEILAQALPDRAAGSFYRREILPWRIMQSFPALLPSREFAELRRYIDRESAALRTYQLASRIADSFDQYLAYRPRMILSWEQGKEQHWQAILWRELVKSAPGLHPPALAAEFNAALRTGTVRLPDRVSLFSISALPEFYLQFLQEISQHTDVHLFLIQPTPHWWSDIRSKREEIRARKKMSKAAAQTAEFARGNTLLASMGKIGREFLEIVSDLTPAEEHEHFAEPAGDTLLGQIQRGIYQLQDNERGVAPNEQSLQFHACHSPGREMEVLHDQLLALFERHPGLKPHDIVVMAPDIAVYAPFIEAVFATSPEEQRIPFSISDRGVRAENGIVDTFLQILESAGSRFTASGVMSLMESSALQRRFCLADPDLETIRSWIEKTGIRWGIDAAHRAELGLPAFNANSWRSGLDRLLLGYATPAHGEQLFDGILAFDEVEGSLAETLGHFAEFVESLFATASSLKQPRTLAQWQESLREITARFFEADDEREIEMRQLRAVVESLTDLPFDGAIPLDVLLAHLEQALANLESSTGFGVGRVNFCALKPMRSVPFRVVCLVGMNDTAFPRHNTSPAFDLIAQHSQRGDRSTRDEDRYLFLEAIVAARDVLYISYVGQSIRDNSKLPPSVLVSELLDYSGASVTHHPLQPFNSRYFTNSSDLFSYSAENCAASAVASAERETPAPFIAQPISKPEDEWRRLNNAQLIRFFGHPTKFFIEQRLNLRLPRADALLEDSEPTEIHNLAKYKLQQDLLSTAIRGEPLEPLLPIARATGELPPGYAGDAKLRELCQAAEDFAELVRQHVSSAAAAPQDIALSIDAFELTARIENLHNDQLVRYRLTTRKPKDLLATWIDHLLINCERPAESVLITADKDNRPVVERFLPVESGAREQLHNLLKLYWRGLREPLRLFPRSSFAFAEETLKGKRDPLQAATAKWRKRPQDWENDKGEKPERRDPYFDVAFRNVPDPLDQEFQQLALDVYLPPLQARALEK